MKNISITSTGGYEILTWPTEEILDRRLGFELDNGGTGVAQVIAILTVAMTMNNAVIIIDEISSFLHPSASKSLLRILMTYYDSHQYIISTHAPEVISFTNPGQAYLVIKEGYRSRLRALTLGTLSEIRETATHLGISSTDVFAADRVVWVEGQTEELCFPFVYEAAVGPIPAGLKILSVSATGDFGAKRRDRSLVFEIYRRITDAANPLLQAVTFSFDRETLDEEDMQKLERDAGGRLHFLPRRNFECFLIAPAAITEVLKSELEDVALDQAAVEGWLAQNGGKPEYGAANDWNGDLDDEVWLRKVDGAKLLNDLFTQTTEARLEFNKVVHSLALLKRCMSNSPSHLTELVEYVRGLVNAVSVK